MKAYTIIKNAVLILAVAMLCLAGILGITSNKTAGSGIAVIAIAVIPTAILGLFLAYTKNDISKKVGYAFLTTAFVLAFVQTLPYEASEISVVFMLIGAGLYAVYYIIIGVALLATRGRPAVDPGADPKITLLKKWKELLDEGMITKEEFEEKRIAILGLKKK